MISHTDRRREVGRVRRLNVKLMFFHIFTFTMFQSICQWNLFDAYLSVLARTFGSTKPNTWVGFAEGIMGFTTLVLAVPLGILADRADRMKLVRAQAAVGFLAAALSVYAFLYDHTVMLYTNLFLWGTFAGLQGTATEAVFADSTEDGDRSQKFTIKGMLNTAGLSLGPLLMLGLFLFCRNADWDLDDLHTPLLVGCVFAPLCCLPLLLMRDPKPETDSSNGLTEGLLEADGGAALPTRPAPRRKLSSDGSARATADGSARAICPAASHLTPSPKGVVPEGRAVWGLSATPATRLPPPRSPRAASPSAFPASLLQSPPSPLSLPASPPPAVLPVLQLSASAAAAAEALSPLATTPPSRGRRQSSQGRPRECWGPGGAAAKAPPPSARPGPSPSGKTASPSFLPWKTPLRALAGSLGAEPHTWLIPYFLTTADFITDVGAGMTVRFFPLFFISEYGVTPVALCAIFCAYPLLCALAMPACHAAGRRVGRAQASFLFQAAGILSLFLMTCVNSLPWLIAIFMLRGALQNAAYPVDRSVLMDFVPSDQRGRWNSVTSLTNMTWSGSAVLGGLMADHHGYRLTFVFTGLIYIAGLTAYSPLLLLVPRKEGSAEAMTAAPATAASDAAGSGAAVASIRCLTPGSPDAAAGRTFVDVGGSCAVGRDETSAVALFLGTGDRSTQNTTQDTARSKGRVHSVGTNAWAGSERLPCGDAAFARCERPRGDSAVRTTDGATAAGPPSCRGAAAIGGTDARLPGTPPIRLAFAEASDDGYRSCAV